MEKKEIIKEVVKEEKKEEKINQLEFNFDNNNNELKEFIDKLDILNTTPLEAINLLYQIKELNKNVTISSVGRTARFSCLNKYLAFRTCHD